MKSIYTITLLLLAIRAAAQFPIGQITTTFNDPARSNRAIATEIYYPATAAGLNQAVAAGQFPVVSFGHGFQLPWSAYQNVWETLVPAGYIVVFPKTEGSLLPNHTNFAKDLAFLVAKMKALNTTAGSPFQNHVAPKSAVFGHSMGGGCAILARQYNADITAIGAFAPAETSPSAIGAAAATARPALIFTGSYDCIAPAAANGLPIYNALNGACKEYVSITGGSHCQFNQFNATCALGEGFSGCASPPISRAQQLAIVHALLVPWLDFQLKGNCGRWADFSTILAGASGFTYLQTCPGTATCTAPTAPATSSITATSAQLNWTNSACAGSHEIQWKISTATAYTSVNVAMPAATFALTGLLPNKTYKWKVRSNCSPAAVGQSSFSTEKTFTTLPNVPPTSVGLVENSTRFRPSVFPNPAVEMLVVRFGEIPENAALQFEVLDLLGRRVASFDQPYFLNGESVELPIGQLPEGSYRLVVRDKMQVETVAFVKSH